MFSTMPLPVFRDDANALPTFSASSPYRPAKTSPLSSSPIRSSPSPPPPPPSPSPSCPLTPRDPNIRRESQSSPIPAPLPHFSSTKFAARPSRPNPVAQKREAAQESRRRLFLKNVRQRAEDRRWEMRGGEQELLKLEWFSLNKDLRQAKNADAAGVVFDSDIEDAARLREEVMSKPRALGMSPEACASHHGRGDVDMVADEMLVDMFEQEQQAELEAMAAELSAQASNDRPPGSPQWFDDEDYDALFMDYLSQEQPEAFSHSQDAAARESEMDLS